MSKNKDEINQIDAATGEKETNASVLSRAVRLAKCLRKFGLNPGDVMALTGRNHLDLHIPHYAALMNGLPLVGFDPTFKYDEIYGLFKLTQPKIVFCQNENRNDFERVAKVLNMDTKIITFDEGECTMAKFMASYDEDGSLEGFEAANFDIEKVYAWLVSTGGTMGAAKIAAFKHRPWVEKSLQLLQMVAIFQNGKVTRWCDRLSLNLSPVQWVSGFVNALAMSLQSQCKLQTSAPLTTELLIDIINEYRPSFAYMGPPLMTSLLNNEKKCDFSSFEIITLTGEMVYKDILNRLKERVNPDAMVMVAYGQTETMGPVLLPAPFGPPGNCGSPMPGVEYKLVDLETGKEVTEPNTPGELWTKGPGFTEYYKNPEETAKVFSEDGWYKTGDILYRDENDYYFFVERMKMLIKSKSYHIIPVELEEVIRTHPDVLNVGVTSVLHPVDGEHAVACVVRRPGSDVTAEHIEALVLEKFSENKQLRGGVVFVDKLPLTSTGKLARKELRNLVLDAKRNRIHHRSHV